MKHTDIRQKLEELHYPVSSLSLGDFDQIGELTAKKSRHPSDPLYRSAGAFFRPNYERGLLIYALIKRYEIRTMLEIGFGRGYASLCAAKAMTDMGFDDGRVYSVDPNFDENHLKLLGQAFPREWLSKLNLIKGTVNDAVLNIKENVDLIYIDGLHTFEGVKYDWECLKDRYSKFVLFDDFDPSSKSPDMQVARFIDGLDEDKELIRSDRRIFFDDRRIPDEQIDYGQVLVKHPKFDASAFLNDW